MPFLINCVLCPPPVGTKQRARFAARRIEFEEAYRSRGGRRYRDGSLQIAEAYGMTKTTPQMSTPEAECSPVQRRRSQDAVAELIDRAHLSRMTMEDKKVEAEVLRLFDRRCAMLVECIRDHLPEAAATFAHTFKGSCRGVGAWHMAQRPSNWKLPPALAIDRDSTLR
jgi:hypothetical protein